MKNRKSIFLLLALAGALLFSGCAPMAITGSAKVEKESFDGQKKFALVTISAGKEINGEQGLLQMFKKNESIPGLNTQPIIDQLVPAIRAKLARTGYYTSVPMRTIVNSAPYKSLQEDERIRKLLFFSGEVNVAKGYKYFSDPQKLARLARDLDVDGVICVTLDFSVVSMKSNVYITAISFGKKEYAASANISLIAYDRQGNVLWKDTTMKQAEPGDKKAIVVLDFTDITGTDFEKLHPSAVLIGSHAVDVVIQRFQDTLEGRETSIFQKIRDKETKEATAEQS